MDDLRFDQFFSSDNQDVETNDEIDAFVIDANYDHIQKKATTMLIFAIAAYDYHARFGVPLPSTLVPKFDKKVKFTF